jgi:WD40 repeat protein
LGIYRGHEGTVYSLDVAWKSGEPSLPSSRRKSKIHPETPGICLVTGSHDQSIVLWDVQASERKDGLSVKVDQSRRIKGHTGDVYAVELFQGENIRKYGMMISGGDYSVRSWKSESGSINHTFLGHTGYVSCLKIHGKRAFSGSWDTTIRSWNLDVLAFKF